MVHNPPIPRARHDPTMIYHVCQLAVSPLLTGSYVRVYEYTYDFDNIG